MALTSGVSRLLSVTNYECKITECNVNFQKYDNFNEDFPRITENKIII